MIGVAAALVLVSLNDNIVFFYSPTQVAEKKPGPERRFRLGGLVEAGSVKKDGLEIRFVVTDMGKTVPVIYRGLLPDLFREGQGVIVEGSLGADGVFAAREHGRNDEPAEAQQRHDVGADDEGRVVNHAGWDSRWGRWGEGGILGGGSCL